MSGPTSRIARHTLAYATGSVIGGISRAILLPVIARKLAPEEYGVLSLLLAATNFLHLVLELGLVTALIRFHADEATDEGRAALRRIALTALPMLDLLLVLPFLLARDLVSTALFGTPEHGLLFAVAAGTAFFGAQFQLVLGGYRAEDRSKAFAGLMAVKGLTALGVTLFLVFGLDLGVAGFLLGNLAGPAVVVLLAVPLRLRGTEPVSRARTRERLAAMLRFGLPLVPSALGLWALSYLDVWLLRVLAGLDAVGLYGFGSEICLPIALLVTSIHLAWPTYAFGRARSEGGPAELARVFRHLFVVLTGGAMAVAVLRHEILAVLGTAEYGGAARVIPLLALATVLYGAAKTFETGLQVAGDTRRLPLFVLVAAAVNAGLNVLLIPQWREVGAAWATVATNLVLMGVVLRESNRQFPIPFERGAIARVLTAAVVVFAAGEFLPEMPWPAAAASRAALCLAFGPVVVLAGGLTREELRSLPSLLRRLATREAA